MRMGKSSRSDGRFQENSGDLLSQRRKLRNCFMQSCTQDTLTGFPFFPLGRRRKISRLSSMRRVSNSAKEQSATCRLKKATPRFCREANRVGRLSTSTYFVSAQRKKASRAE